MKRGHEEGWDVRNAQVDVSNRSNRTKVKDTNTTQQIVTTKIQRARAARVRSEAVARRRGDGVRSGRKFSRESGGRDTGNLLDINNR